MRQGITITSPLSALGHCAVLNCVCFMSVTLFRVMPSTGFIRVREMSGEKNQGQGIVREFYVVSGKNECLLKCQGNVRKFYNFQFVSNDEKQIMAWTVL